MNREASRSLYGPALLIAAAVVAGAALARPTPRPFQSVEPPLAHVPCDVQGRRPRPRPEPPEPPAPSPESEVERRLFPRIESLIEARAIRIENRAEAKAEQCIEEAFNEVEANLDAAIQGADPELMQGSFGAAFVARLATFVKKAVMFIVSAVLLTVIGALIVKYWFVVGPVGLFLFIALPAWSARTFSRKGTP